MVVECVAAIIVILMTSYFYLLAKKPNTSLSVLPLTFVPVMFLISKPLSKLFEKSFSWDLIATQSLFVLIGAVSACCIFGYLSTKLHKKTAKMFYNIFCSGFTVIFAWIIIMKLV